jgi:hypothetical protein
MVCRQGLLKLQAQYREIFFLFHLLVILAFNPIFAGFLCPQLPILSTLRLRRVAFCVLKMTESGILVIVLLRFRGLQSLCKYGISQDFLV